eukprot:m.351312 g.351312  ORF g.351312 m.351312 type:complete len:61 (+) comp27976_c0_seq1:1614-1796(+)
MVCAVCGTMAAGLSLDVKFLVKKENEEVHIDGNATTTDFGGLHVVVLHLEQLLEVERLLV